MRVTLSILCTYTTTIVTEDCVYHFHRVDTMTVADHHTCISTLTDLVLDDESRTRPLSSNSHNIAGLLHNFSAMRSVFVTLRSWHYISTTLQMNRIHHMICKFATVCCNFSSCLRSGIKNPHCEAAPHRCVAILSFPLLRLTNCDVKRFFMIILL